MSTDSVQSDLGVDYTSLKYRVGRELAVPDDESNWTAQQAKTVDQVIADGLRQYYQPPAVDQYPPHEWSFLNPIGNLKTQANQRWYELPDDFESLNSAGCVTYANDNQQYSPIRITNEAHLRALEFVYSGSTSFPRYSAVRPLHERGVARQRWEIGFDPTPDSAYELQYQYRAAPYMLTEERPYPLGGKSHSQGLLLSCLAAAELYEFNVRGEYYKAFIDQLRADIAQESEKITDDYRLRWSPSSRRHSGEGRLEKGFIFDHDW